MAPKTAASVVQCTIEDGVALVTLNNPPLNVVTLTMTRELNALLKRLAADANVRVLVLTGSGDRAFCAGSDISEFPEMMKAGTVLPKKLAFENETYSAVDDFPKPSIAALNGLAFGGGLELATCCDLLVAEAGNKVALPEIKLGVMPGSGGTIRVTRLVGEARAKEMMFFGDPISVETAMQWGIINRVVAKGEAVKTALEMARTLATRPNFALQMCKQSIDMALDRTEDEGIAASLKLSDRLFASADGQEGVRAFFAKEPPKFKHR